MCVCMGEIGFCFVDGMCLRKRDFFFFPHHNGLTFFKERVLDMHKYIQSPKKKTEYTVTN